MTSLEFEKMQLGANSWKCMSRAKRSFLLVFFPFGFLLTLLM